MSGHPLTWEMVQIDLEAARDYANPYTELQVWVDLSGPGFAKRCHGFWKIGRASCRERV